MKDVRVLYDKEEIYQSQNDNIIETYMDLWKSDKERRGMAEFGVGSLATRKAWSGDDGAQSINQSKNLFKNTQSFQHELISKRGVYLSRYY